VTSEPNKLRPADAKAGSGVAGLDEVLGGGFPAYRVHLIEGAPGAGKTTLASQFLLEGVKQGESVLYVTLSETSDELQAVARSHTWSLDGVALYELAPSEESLRLEEQYTVFHPAEVELGETVGAVLTEVERTKPVRVVFDSLSELRLLARDPLRYRRQILGLRQFFAGRRCTVLLLDELNPPGTGVQSISHSVIQLDHDTPDYRAERRQLRVLKVRGVPYCGGYHDFIIQTGGLRVFPRLVATEHHEPFAVQLVSSGVEELDSLLGGGVHRGTSTLLVGPAGVGKSVVAMQYAAAAAARGQRTVVYLFDEAVTTYLTRAEGLQIPICEHVASGPSTPASSALVSALAPRANVTFLERPVRVTTLVSATEMALRTRRRQYELRDHLLARLRAEAAERDAHAEAEQAMRTRDQLLASVAHDLKNPLSAIKGYAQLLRRRAARSEVPVSDQITEGLAAIDATVTRAVAQIDELLDLARSQVRQALRLNPTSVDLVALTQSTVGQYRAASPDYQIKVETDLPELIGIWDQARLERVLGNLLTNAIKYSPAGSEVVVRLHVEESRGDAFAVLSVSDQGIGIPTEDLPHVFEPFYRAANAVGQTPGTGLGLAGVRHIVEQHRGAVSVRSQVGAGTTFTIRLPLVPVEGGVSTVAPDQAAFAPT